jgi:hypothetical protein
MQPNTLASAFGGAVALAFLWFFVTGVGYPSSASSLLIFFLCVISAAALIFHSRRWLVLSIGISVLSLAYSLVLAMTQSGAVEYLSAGLAAAYLLSSAYAYSRFDKAKYLTPLDMPVYG